MTKKEIKDMLRTMWRELFAQLEGARLSQPQGCGFGSYYQSKRKKAIKNVRKKRNVKYNRTKWETE